MDRQFLMVVTGAALVAGAAVAVTVTQWRERWPSSPGTNRSRRSRS